MSGTETSLNKAIAYVFIGFVLISAILGLTFFLGPRTGDSNGLFQTTIRYYTMGMESLYYTDYAQAIVQDIQDIGIEVLHYQMDYSTFLDRVFGSKGFDLALIEIEEQNVPHLELFFKEQASLNVFNFQDKFDDGYTSEFLGNITQETDFYTRKNYFYDLQDHLMENVLPMFPLFTPVRTYAFWGNLNGFSANLGLSHSLPYMSFSSLREGQTISNLLKAGISRWFDLNSLSMREEGEKVIVSLIMDKLIEINENGAVTKYGLIDNWDFVNQTTLLLHVRNGVEWQPDPDGVSTNEPFTVDDVIFTFDLLRSLYSNLNLELYDWIDSYEVYNGSTVALYIDSNSTSIKRETYAFPLEDLSTYPFPKYYLNEQDDSVEQVVNSDEWEKFGNTPFGTGKYIFNQAETNIDLGVVVLNRFDDWHGVGVLPGQTTNLVFETVELLTYDDDFGLEFDLLEGTGIDIADFGTDPAIEEKLESEPSIILDFSIEDSIIFLAFNLENSIFGGDNNFVPTTEEGVSKALAIRKAIASAIDRPSMNSGFHNNRYNITDTPVSIFYKDYYNPNVVTYDYNLDQAISYLQLAGFNITTDGFDTLNETSFNFISTTVGLGIGVFVMIIISKKRKKM